MGRLVPRAFLCLLGALLLAQAEVFAFTQAKLRIERCREYQVTKRQAPLKHSLVRILERGRVLLLPLRGGEGECAQGGESVEGEAGEDGALAWDKEEGDGEMRPSKLINLNGPKRMTRAHSTVRFASKKRQLARICTQGSQWRMAPSRSRFLRQTLSPSRSTLISVFRSSSTGSPGQGLLANLPANLDC